MINSASYGSTANAHIIACGDHETPAACRTDRTSGGDWAIFSISRSTADCQPQQRKRARRRNHARCGLHESRIIELAAQPAQD